jgi:alpha-ribazole phosphatase/probable phosphoglycerate mutase
MSVRLVFETHSTTEDNETGIMTGWLAGRLSPAGRAQAAELGARRGDMATIFSSDLGRSVETASIAFPGRDVLLDWRLRECDYGELNGTPKAYRDAYPGGESWQEAVARVHGFLDELVATRDGERVLVIGHMATRYGIVTYTTGRPLEEVLAEEFAWQPGWEHVVG